MKQGVLRIRPKGDRVDKLALGLSQTKQTRGKTITTLFHHHSRHLHLHPQHSASQWYIDDSHRKLGNITVNKINTADKKTWESVCLGWPLYRRMNVFSISDFVIDFFSPSFFSPLLVLRRSDHRFRDQISSLSTLLLTVSLLFLRRHLLSDQGRNFGAEIANPVPELFTWINVE